MLRFHRAYLVESIANITNVTVWTHPRELPPGIWSFALTERPISLVPRSFHCALISCLGIEKGVLFLEH